MRLADIQPVINAYGTALAEPTALGIVRDARALPFSKDDIKSALTTAIKITGDPEARESLKAAYIALADFQTLSSKEVRALRAWSSALTQNTPAGDLADDGALVTAVQQRVAEEAKALLQELKAEGF